MGKTLDPVRENAGKRERERERRIDIYWRMRLGGQTWAIKMFSLSDCLSVFLWETGKVYVVVFWQMVCVVAVFSVEKFVFFCSTYNITFIVHHKEQNIRENLTKVYWITINSLELPSSLFENFFIRTACVDQYFYLPKKHSKYWMFCFPPIVSCYNMMVYSKVCVLIVLKNLS